MRIGIVAGESSGDLLGAGLISAIKEIHPDAEFEGIAGPAMVEQGCKQIYPAEKLSLLGLVEVLAHYRELRGIRDELAKHFSNHKPDVFIGIDAPEFNLGLEEKLHNAGIKTVQYVSPQIWAWRKKRVKKIAAAVDLVMTLFPFEADFYKNYNVPVKFVGHPLADMIPMKTDVMAKRMALGLPTDKKIIALLPGSRVSEVKRLTRPFFETAQWCTQKRQDLHFILPVANEGVAVVIEALRAEFDLPLTLLDGQSREAMEAADVLLMASGTATLEGLLYKKPMVVAYKLAWLTYKLLKRMVKLSYYSLPNLLAGRKIVPEIIQDDVRADVLGPEVLAYLDEPNKGKELLDVFESIHMSLKQGTNIKAATAVIELVKQ